MSQKQESQWPVSFVFIAFLACVAFCFHTLGSCALEIRKMENQKAIHSSSK